MRNRSVLEKQRNKDIILMRDTLNYLEGISRLNRSKDSFATNQDLLESASFQLLQVSRNLKSVSKKSLKLLPSIDMVTLHSWRKNLMWNYFRINHDMLIAYLKDISRDTVKNEITSAYKTILEAKENTIHTSKKKQKRKVA